MGSRGSSGVVSGSNTKQNNTNYGVLVDSYPNGAKEYEKYNTELTKAEAREQYSSMKNTIEADIAKQLNVSKDSLEFDTNTGIITKWNTGNTGPRREVYRVSISATKVTKVNGDKVKTYYKDEVYRPKFISDRY